MVTTRLENRSEEKTNPCIWMQAGVVHRKFCKSDYLCIACRFDRTMQIVADENMKIREACETPKGKRGKIVSWKEKLMELPPRKRPCLHHMKGRIGFRACNHEYRCSNCEFDQYFHDQYTIHAVVKPVDVLDIEGFKIPQGFYLHEGHAWVKIEESSEVRVGIDDFALRLLGPIDRIDAPLMGKEIRQNHEDISLSRGSHTAKVLSPVSGVVTAVNLKVREQGHLANEDPYSEGWVLRVHSKNLRKDLKNLVIGGETESFLEKEVDRLYRVVEEEAGLMAADGGYLGDDIYGNIPQVGWEKLTKLFLHT